MKFLPILLLSFLLTACGSHVYHVVRPGDTLYSIGFRYNQDYRDIAQWNDIGAPYKLRRGQRLRVAPPLANAGSFAEEGGRASVSTSTGVARVPERKLPPVVSPNHSNASRPPPQTDDDSRGLRWQWPTQGQIIRFFSDSPPANKGVDIEGVLGQSVHAAATGKVVYSGSGLIGYGKLIIVKHNNTYLSAYAHNDHILVAEGDEVSAGQQIARMGKTGAERVMLHFEIRRNGKPVNPMERLPKR